MAVLIRGGIVVTGNARGEIHRGGSVLIEGNRIESLYPAGRPVPPTADTVVDADGLVVIPGFVQTHVHLCQTLFRGMADDLSLLDWLRTKIFPLEASHDERSMRASALLGIAELLRSGTTTILDMGSMRHEDHIARAIAETGLRAFLGKSLIDTNDLFPAFRETTRAALASTRQLAEYWHNSYDGRIRYAVAPRFVLSCTDELLRESFGILRDFPGMLYHTHASENHGELATVVAKYGMRNVEYFHHLGVLSQRTVLAHCIHLSPSECDMLAESRTAVAHCPSSNLKLGSGVADVPAYLARGIRVGLGADGAPCNNSLDMFHEMRLASLLQKPRHGPAAMPAREVFALATSGGAKVLGLEHEIGTLEPGKKADLVLVDLRHVWDPPLDTEGSIYSALVYSGRPDNVEAVMVDGRWLYRSGAFTTLDVEEVLADSRRERERLLERL